MSESKNKTGIKTKRDVVAAEKKTATAVKKAAAVVKKRIKNAAPGRSECRPRNAAPPEHPGRSESTAAPGRSECLPRNAAPPERPGRGESTAAPGRSECCPRNAASQAESPGSGSKGRRTAFWYPHKVFRLYRHYSPNEKTCRETHEQGKEIG